MIDIHCHLLPGIDDGPQTIEEALLLAQALVADGVEHVVCTPHVFPGRFPNLNASIQDDFDKFVPQLRSAGIDLSLSWAGEVRLTPEILALNQKGLVPLLGESASGKTVMLLEMPDGQVPVGTEQFIERLQRLNIKAVIAHPERNRGVMDNVERIRDLVSMGCYMQLTAGSLTGHFGERAQRTAQAMMDAGWVHAVASDAHNVGARRPRMTEARDWLHRHYGAAVARQLTFFGPSLLCKRLGKRLPLPNISGVQGSDGPRPLDIAL